MRGMVVQEGRKIQRMATLSFDHSNPPSKYFRNGVLPILAASTLWAFVYLFRKTALYGISPAIFTFANSVIGALSLWFFCRFPLRDVWTLFLRAPYRFLALGFTGVSVGTTLMIAGLDHLDLSVALVLEKLQPIFTWILAAIFLREKIRREQIPWVILAVTASYFVSVKDPWGLRMSDSDVLGVAAISGAAFSWGISSVLGRSLVTMCGDFRQLVFLRFVIGAILLTPILCFSPSLGLRFSMDTYVASVVVFSSVFGSTAGYALFYSGLRYVTASVSGFLELVTPVVGILLGVALLGESPSLSQLIAIPTMLLAVLKLSRRSPLEAEN